MGETSYEMSTEGSVSLVRECDVAVNWYVSMGTKRSEEKECLVGTMLTWCSCVREKARWSSNVSIGRIAHADYV
eukprot:scaffold93296_cov32-Tisochrysis_lutea.AAC.1